MNKDVAPAIPHLPLTAEQPARQIPPLWMRIARAAVACAALLPASCVDAGEAEGLHASDNPQIEVPAPQSTPDSELDGLPDDWPACRPHEDSHLGILAAERCLDAMQYGRVALITFDMPQERAETVAADVGKLIEESTAGRVRMTYEVVPASPETVEAVEDTAADKGCVDHESWTSRTADEVMDLDDYDYVMSMPNLYACRGNEIGGVAEFSGRYAEIFMSDRQSNRRLIHIIAHENGHLLGLGHDSTALGRVSDGAFATIRVPISATEPFDIIEHLNSGKYTEYSTGNVVMGAPMDDASNPAFSRIHLNYLDWPKEVLYGNQAFITIGEHPVRFTPEDVESGLVGRVVLPEAVAVDMMRGDKSHSVTFDSIVIVPYVNIVQPQLGIINARLYLENTGRRNIISIGSAGSATDGATWTLKVDDTMLRIHIDENRNMHAAAVDTATIGSGLHP